MWDHLASLDRLIFCAINAGWSHPGLDIFFGLFTHLGQGAILAVLGVIFLYRFDRLNFPKNFLVLTVILLLGGWWGQILKALVNRPRPFHDAALGVATAGAIKTQIFGLMDRTAFLLHPQNTALSWVKELHVIGPLWGSHSFPSGHTVAAFGAATALIFLYRRYMWLMLIPAALVGLSRVYVGVHFPSDVLAGAILGTANSWILLAWTRKYSGLGLIRPKPPVPSSHPPENPLIMIVAGEASADTYAARLIAAVRDKKPGARFIGIGGPQAGAAGLEIMAHAADISIVGFTGAVAGVAKIRRAYLALLKAMDRQKPDVLICIDLPDFNLALANQARARGVAVMYYISPQVWAWRISRISIIADRVNRMVVAFPFERDLFRKRGIDARFFGHPLLESIRPAFASRAEARAVFGLALDKKVVVLAPGSRTNEIKYLTGRLAAAARELASRIDDVQFVVPLAPTVDENEIRSVFQAAGVNPIYTRDQFNDLLACADAGAITSGTATLEAALAGLPHVLVYRGNWLNYAIARRLVKVDKIGLPNIILERLAFTELIQDECTPQAIAARLEALLAGPEREKSLAACAEVQQKLTGRNVSAQAAEQALDLIGQRHAKAGG